MRVLFVLFLFSLLNANAVIFISTSVGLESNEVRENQTITSIFNYYEPNKDYAEFDGGVLNLEVGYLSTIKEKFIYGLGLNLALTNANKVQKLYPDKFRIENLPYIQPYFLIGYNLNEKFSIIGKMGDSFGNFKYEEMLDNKRRNNLYKVEMKGYFASLEVSYLYNQRQQFYIEFLSRKTTGDYINLSYMKEEVEIETSQLIIGHRFYFF